jgi:hypothetical protein
MKQILSIILAAVSATMAVRLNYYLATKFDTRIAWSFAVVAASFFYLVEWSEMKPNIRRSITDDGWVSYLNPTYDTNQ